MQGDVYQAGRGSHGEYQIIALAPSSVGEMFTLTIEAFNLAETYRTPVVVLSDATVGHLMETVEIPDISAIKIVERKKPEKNSGAKYFLDEDVAPMPVFGLGYRAHVTGSTHDERGFRNVEDPVYVDKVVKALYRKIHKYKDQIVRVETKYLDDAEVALLTYGSVARTANYVVKSARKEGMKVGLVKLITLWPFADSQVREVARKVGKIVVMENNLGQIVNKVREVAAKYADVEFLPPRIIGTLHEPAYVMGSLRGICK
jgi:2-oxoglutarate ferredoxin oxidoreductase subunit alpha